MQIVSCFEGLDSQYTNISCSLIDISQIKSHVYGKQQTSICSARNHFSYICRLLFIIVTNKIVVSGQLHASMRVTVNPLLSPPGRLFISSRFEGRLNRDRGRAYLIETRRSIGGKAQVQEDLGHAAEDQNQIRTSSW